jgi:hypothetical protein
VAPGGDDGIRVVAEATEGSSSSEVVLPPEWKACLDKKEEKRVASARAEHRRESIEADTTPPSPLKGHQRASEDEGCAANGSGSSTHHDDAVQRPVCRSAAVGPGLVQ